MKKNTKILLFLILFNFSSVFINAQVPKGKWYTKEITINHREPRNPDLLQLNINAFMCNEGGNPMQMGRCVYIKNLSKDTLYYRNAPIRYYQNKKAVDWTWSPANMLTYYPILPGHHEIICAGVYEDAKSRGQPCKMVAEFKFFVPEALDKNKKNTLLNDSKDVTIQTPINSKIPVNSFYVFFTTNINVKPKESQFSALQSTNVLTVISKPVLHKGAFSDLLIAEKEAFVDQMIQQVPAIPDNYKGLMASDNYEAVKTYYAKPYSTVLPKNEKEVYDAIEAYKEDWYNTTNGLSIANTKKFFQLR